MRIRWGVISTAKIGLNRVIPAIKASRNGTVVAIASRDFAKARKAADDAEIERAYGSYEELIADPAVDAIYNPLPNDGHLPWSLAAAKAHKPTLVEKPIARNAAEAEQIVAAFRTEGVLLAEAFMYRYHPQYEVISQLLNEGSLGPLTLIDASFTFAMSPDRTEDIRLVPEMGGGSLLDVGCYCVNFCRMIAGSEPTAVSAFAQYGATNVDDSFVGTLHFVNGLLAHFDCGFRAFLRSEATIRGPNGIIRLLNAFRFTDTEPIKVLLQEANGREETFTLPLKNTYQLMVEDFADAVIHKRPMTYDPADSIKNMRVLDALAESARKEQTIHL